MREKAKRWLRPVLFTAGGALAGFGYYCSDAGLPAGERSGGNADAAMTYGVYSLPTTFFIDAEGYGIAQATGAINGETLQRGIDMILPQK